MEPADEVTGRLSGDSPKVKKDLEAFAAVNDPRLYKLIKACVHLQTDLKTLIKSKVRCTIPWIDLRNKEILS